MTVDDEVAVGSLLVLADASFKQWRLFQGREAEADVLANVFERVGADDALAVGGIEGGAAGVVGDLEAAPSAAGNAVTKTPVMVTPDGQMAVAETVVSGGGSEEKNVLLGGANQIADCSGKQLAQPWAAGEDVIVGLQMLRVRGLEAKFGMVVEAFGQHFDLPVLSSGGEERVHDCAATGAGIEVTALWFENSPGDSFEVNLRPALLHLRHGQFVMWNLCGAQHLDRAALKGILVSRSHPQNAAAMEKLPLPAAFIFRPQLQRAGCQFCIRLIRTIDAAHHASF